MRHWGSTLLASAVALAAGTVAAQQPRLETTADLVEFCDTEGAVGEVRDGHNFCDGFIAGSGLLMEELVRAGRIEDITCADPTPTLAQAREAFVAWAMANPDHMQSRPIDGMWRAFAETYPCP